jgi:hypothetical protein
VGIKAIAIVLGDNDYENTFRPLLESIKRAIEYHGELTKEQAAWMIREGIAWHYTTFQNLGRGNPGRGVLGYLGSVRILFDDAACADTMHDHDGGAWFLDVESGQITSY